MNTSQRERGLFNFLDGQAENGSIQENQINHSQTSENMSGDENSGHGETPNTPKSYETQKLTIINEHTQKERTNYTTIGNVFSIGNDLSHHAREIKFLGKKTSEPGIPDNELDMEQVSETVIDALTNNIQFLKDLSLNFYGYNLDFKINKDLIKQKDFIEKNLDKTIKTLLLMMMEDIGPQEKEMIKNEIKTILELELKLKDKFLPFCTTIFNMNLKNLLLNYINDRNDKLNNFKLKTLEDNPKYSNEEKIGIRKQILSYLKSQKELTSSINDHEMPFNLPPFNLFQLPINDVNEENLSPENIDSVHHIENNQSGNHFENNQSGNHFENNETENHIENNEIKNSFENNEIDNHIENNQTENHNNLIEETQEPNETSQKLDDKTNEKPKGGRNENLTRIAVNKSFDYLLDMIKEIANDKLNDVTIYHDISGNSTEKYKVFFKKEIGEIIGRTNDKFVESILNSNDASKEIQFLKGLFKTEYFNIIEIFMNDLPFSFTRPNGGKVEFKTIKNFKDQRIEKKIFAIRRKIKRILQSNGRLRAKSNKNK